MVDFLIERFNIAIRDFDSMHINKFQYYGRLREIQAMFAYLHENLMSLERVNICKKYIENIKNIINNLWYKPD